MLRTSLIAAPVLLLALSLAAQQQDNSTPPPQQNPPNAPAPQKKDSPAKDQAPKDQPKKSTADQNPFPEAQSEAAAHQQNSDPSAPQPQTAPQPGSPAKPGDQNAFPQEQSERAAHQDQPPGKSEAPGDARDQEYSSSQEKGLDMPTSDAPASSETPPSNLPPSSLPYNPKLARKDAEIGDFYMQSGNWRGAYERFIEANRSDPGNPEAVFGLAESARRLSHMDEALRNYRLYLSALPNGPHAKEVRKALKEMGDAPPA